MENKILTLTVLSILSIVAVLGMISAAITLYPDSYSASISQGSSGSFTFRIYNDGTAPGYTYTLVSITSTVSNLVGTAGTLSSSQVSVGTMPSSIANQTNSSLITVSINVPSSQSTGTYAGNITIGGINNETSTAVTSKNIALSVNVTPASSPVSCEYGNAYDNLRIKKIEFTNNGFSGFEFGEDDEWFPIDKITAEITVENKGEEKIEDISLEWGLYDSSTGEWVIDFDEEDEFDVKSDDEEVISVEFSLDDADMDLEDLDEGTYEFYVRATGFDNEYEEDICDLETEEAEVIIEADFVVLDEVSVPESTSCGTDFLVSADVWNIGDDDQEGVYVNVYNKELKIDKNVEVGDVDAFSYEKLDANIAIPKNATSKTYGFVFSVYDENDDIYQNDYDDEESVFTIPVKVVCSDVSGGVLPKTVVSASLESGGKAGQALVVKSAITNLENKDVAYTVSPVGYSTWADSAKADQNMFTLGAGESKSVSITFDVKDDAQGEKFFDIEIYSGNELVTKQPVSVAIEKKGFSLAQLGEGNQIFWVIAIIILLIVIILVAIKIIKK